MPRWELPTCQGTVRLVLVPSPSWPPALLPQHHNDSSVRVAHVWVPPTETVSQLVAVPILRGALGSAPEADL